MIKIYHVYFDNSPIVQGSIGFYLKKENAIKKQKELQEEYYNLGISIEECELQDSEGIKLC